MTFPCGEISVKVGIMEFGLKPATNFVKAVFSNLFAAVEPWTSVKVTQGTPCIKPWVQQCKRATLIFLAGQSPHGKDKADKDDQL